MLAQPIFRKRQTLRGDIYQKEAIFKRENQKANKNTVSSSSTVAVHDIANIEKLQIFIHFF